MQREGARISQEAVNGRTITRIQGKKIAARLTAAAIIVAGILCNSTMAPAPFCQKSVLASTAAATAGGSSDWPINESAEGTDMAPVDTVNTYVVAHGDTLSGIARVYGIDVASLLEANPETDERIQPGDTLSVPLPDSVIHTVEAGDTLWDMAQQYNVPVELIMKANNLRDDTIYVGERLIVSAVRHRDVHTASRSMPVRFIWPTTGENSSLYGHRWGRLHAGIDIANDIGTSVAAARAGRVVFAGWQSGYGYMVIIDHGGHWSTLYGHLDDYTVTVGQHVPTGYQIGYMGETGNSTGPHLHFEMRLYGKPVNPLYYLH